MTSCSNASRGWSFGPLCPRSEVEGFENRFASYCGAAHGAGVGSGLDALTSSFAHGGGPGDEVIVPSHTFIATWLAVEQVGATVVPIEPDAATLTLDGTHLEQAITARTRAGIPVHLYCQPAAMDVIMTIAEKHGLMVLEDASQVHGARFAGTRVGSLGHAAAFSLYPTKPLGGMGDGESSRPRTQPSPRRSVACGTTVPAGSTITRPWG